MNHSLPKKNIAAGALIKNHEGKTLIVKPTYSEDWHIPGGVVEAFESPLKACIREVLEETNLTIEPKRLLAVSHEHSQPDHLDKLIFVFDGGTITESQADAIRFPPDEIEAFKFASLTELKELLDSTMASIVHHVYTQNNTSITVYLENSVLIE